MVLKPSRSEQLSLEESDMQDNTLETSPDNALNSALDKTEPSRRHARALVFHILYAAEAHDYDTSVPAIIENLNHGFDTNIPLKGPIAEMAEWIIEHRNDLDNEYSRFFENWQFERVSVATKLILRFALFELLQTDTDPRIIINEAIELAKCFAEDDAYRFINGVLDRATTDLGRFVPVDDQMDQDDQENQKNNTNQEDSLSKIKKQ